MYIFKQLIDLFKSVALISWCYWQRMRGLVVSHQYIALPAVWDLKSILCLKSEVEFKACTGVVQGPWTSHSFTLTFTNGKVECPISWTVLTNRGRSSFQCILVSDSEWIRSCHIGLKNAPKLSLLRYTLATYAFQWLFYIFSCAI